MSRNTAREEVGSSIGIASLITTPVPAAVTQGAAEVRSLAADSRAGIWQLLPAMLAGGNAVLFNWGGALVGA
jgi:hypothetical protein